MIDIENIGERFFNIASSSEWQELQDKYNYCADIYVLGHGGNMGVADHTAIDMTRLSNGTKNATCPGSCVVATSLINDTDFDQWMTAWLQHRTATRTPEQIDKSLVYGISSSGTSKDVLNALKWASMRGMKTCLITSKPTDIKIEGLTQIILGTEYYHTAEVLTLLLQYQLTHGSGNECPPINKNKPEDLKKLNWNKGIREHSYPDEKINLAIDFDGVIHKNSKGFYDGTIYDTPVDGALEAIKELSEKYVIIVFSSKARADRMLVNGKTGIQLIWEWLEANDMKQYVSSVTAEKPRAVAYIDDKGIRFDNWKDALAQLKDLNLL